jgi:Uma2 family endonuclease
MNTILSPLPNRRLPTRAAEALPRWRWSVAEIERMAVDGYFRDDDRFELVGGEIVPMSPKGRRHETIRIELGFHFTRQAPEGIFVAPEPQFNLDDDSYVVPDILVYPRAIPTSEVRGGDALRIIGIADTSLRHDLEAKAPLYAAHGVREYWVINAMTVATMVHREPSDNGYASVKEVAPAHALSAALVPQLSVSRGWHDLRLC